MADSFDCSTLDPSFVPTSYLGALDPSGPSWLTQPWISLAQD